MKMELWDMYDAQGNLTGRVIERGHPQEPGEYHLAVTIVVVSSKGEVLCTLRSMEKSQMPGVWENPGGGVLAGEKSPAAAVRELLEEAGLIAAPEELAFLTRRRSEGMGGEPFLMDVYGLRRDVDPAALALQPGEVDGARWFPIDEWEQKARAGEILAGAYSDVFFAAVRKLAGRPLPAEQRKEDKADGYGPCATDE